MSRMVFTSHPAKARAPGHEESASTRIVAWAADEFK